MLGFGKADLFDVLYGKDAHARAPRSVEAHEERRVNVASLEPWRMSYDTGSKFPGGFGPTEFLVADYWTLRARSAQLFEQNLYARGLIRRMVCNEINTGLHLEATPIERLLGFPEDGLAEWCEDVEDRFGIWSRDPFLCDHAERHTFGELQQIARCEALVCGDVLVVLRQDPRTKLPRIQLISGAAVQTPLGHNPLEGNRISHGVELDTLGRHVAFHVRQADGTSKRLPAFGEKSGRRIAWLLYGTDKRLDDVRGKPILSLVLQSLREIDRYRDSTQRKAVINSMLAMFIQKNADKPGSRAMTTVGAVRRGVETTVDTTGQKRSFRVAEHIPGLVLDELQTGEEPKAFTTNQTVENFGTFEEAIIQAVAWGNGLPPEIYRLSFSSNYSASQAAINEYKMELNMLRTRFGCGLCTPVYEEWLLAQALAGKVKADGLLDAWRDAKLYDIYGSWMSCDWAGQIKPAVDLSKLVGGYKQMTDEGWITRDRSTRELTGMKFSKVVQRLRLENEQLAKALEPIKAFLGVAEPPPAPDAPDDESESKKDVAA